jgi:polyisoprenoid-binding protein YceI
MMPARRLAAVGLTALCLTALPPAAHARPVAYVLQPDRSTVAFETDFGREHITGSFPLLRAALTLDFDQAANSSIDVVLDVTRARASFPFAAQAMKGEGVLDAGHHPQMHFASSRVSASGDGAEVQGQLTIRGLTRPVTLHAAILREVGRPPGDRSHLSVRLTGLLHRSDFGATGWADLVGDDVRIRIDARIVASD